MNEYLEFYQKWINKKNEIKTLENEIYEKEIKYNSKNKKDFSQYSKRSFFNKEKNELLALYKKLRNLTESYEGMNFQRFPKLYELKYNGAKFEDDKRWWFPPTNGQPTRIPEDELIQELKSFEYAILEKAKQNESNNYSDSSSQIR